MIGNPWRGDITSWGMRKTTYGKGWTTHGGDRTVLEKPLVLEEGGRIFRGEERKLFEVGGRTP